MFGINPLNALPCSVTRYLPAVLQSSSCAPPSFLATAYNNAVAPLSSTYTTLRTAMSAIVSLPFLSFLLIPTMTSYSTSLNLLFFYLTWSTLVLSHAPLHVEIVATLAIRILFYLIPSMFCLLFDALLPSAAESLKFMGETALPLKSGKRERSLLVGKMVLWSLANLVLSVLVQAGVEVLLTRGLGLKSALKVTTTLPMPLGIFKDLLRGWLLREILGYTLHRFALHDPNSPISQYHDGWYHSMPAPIPMSASYDHPVAYLIRCFVPTFGPALLFRFHLLTYIVFLSLVSLEETFTHSGYSTVPTNFVLGGIARRVEGHIVSGGKGNFGPVGIMDWVFGSSLGADVMEDFVAEGARQDVNGKMDMAKDVVKQKGRGAQTKTRPRRGRED